MLNQRTAQKLLAEYFMCKGRKVIDVEEFAAFVQSKGYLLIGVGIALDIAELNEEVIKEPKSMMQDIPPEVLNDPLIQFTNALGKENGSA